MTTATIGQEAVTVEKPDDDDVQMWSVTTIIGALDKPALLYWSAEMAAVAAVGQQATWRGMLEDCDDSCPHDAAKNCQAVKWLRDARNRRPKNLLSAKDLGTTVHALCEGYALTGIRPDAERIAHEIREQGGRGVDVSREQLVVTSMLNKFDGWLQRFTPSYQATEVCVYSPTYGYAGQTDALMTIDGVRFIADYKTSRDPYDSRGKPKTPYPEQVGLQLAAYRWAEHAAVWRPRRFEQFRRRYYLLSPAERERAVPVPEVDTGLVIQITPEHCEAYPIRCDETVHTDFLYVIESFGWLQERSKRVLGDALTPGGSK